MTIEPDAPNSPNGFQDLVKRFWGFDHMIGSALIKILYYIGLVGIGLFTLLITLSGLAGGGYGGYFGGGVIMLIAGPILGLVWLVVWRFICELWLLMFLIYGRMGEIRDRLPPR